MEESNKNNKGYLVGFNCCIVSQINTENIHKRVQKYIDEDQNISFGDIVLHAICQSLKDFPEFNSYFESERIISPEFNLGFSINLGEGPKKVIIKNVDKLTLSELSNEIKKYALKYMRGKLVDDFKESTFSIINLSFFDSHLITTPVFEKQSALFSIASEHDTFKIVDNRMFPLKKFNLTLSYDARVADCQKALDLLNLIKGKLEKE